MEDLLIRLKEAKNIINEAIEYLEENKPIRKNKCAFNNYCEHQNYLKQEKMCNNREGELCIYMFKE